MLGETSLLAEPSVHQVFIGRGTWVESEDDFERRLFVIRKLFEREVERRGIGDSEDFYFPSLSCRTVVYKGMLTALQLPEYYPDLRDRRMVTALAMFHSRFSTNTFPSWKLAHPYRTISHNGEINTLRGNKNWMAAREALLESPHFEDINKIIPIIDEAGSDTACLDNALELLTLGGRPIEHAMMMLIPEAWSGHETMSAEKKAFYEYHSLLMEPWDGPASVAFTDGRTIGAVLDRNGLRPSRYLVTKDDLVVMASESGVLPVEDDNVLMKGRLQPGRMFLVSLEEGRIIGDTELKQRLARAHDYDGWLGDNLTRLAYLPGAEPPDPVAGADLLERQIAFGYTVEDAKYHLGPMARQGQESIGSMGTDTPLAVLSERPQPLYNYFKQLFAQVTNPPLDAIREEIVTSVDSLIGAEGNLFSEGLDDGYRMIALPSPFLTNAELAQLQALDGESGFRSAVLPMTMPAADGPRACSPPLPSSSSAPTRPSRAAPTSSSSPTAASTGSTRPSPRCSPPPASTTTSCATSGAPRSASSSKRARRARCTTSPSSSVTAPAPSTPTSRWTPFARWWTRAPSRATSPGRRPRATSSRPSRRAS